jgi:cobalamin biosynthetic protein CobC
MNSTLTHGGQLNKIAKEYQRPIEQWIDLSTGISPVSYPIPDVPLSVWQQLPQPSVSLINAAKQYYNTNNIVATSGSQAVIAKLPLLFSRHIALSSTVWLPEVGYKEHEKSWEDAGHIIKRYQQLPQLDHLCQHCIVVVINPNNPTGMLYQKKQLISLLQHIKTLAGWLIVDEAFMDVIEPSESIIDHTHNKNLLVLRSVGKFFGLAGIRIGFLSAHQYWLKKLAEVSSPWEVNGPAQFITEEALLDYQWQRQQKQKLLELAQQWEVLLIKFITNHLTKGHEKKEQKPAVEVLGTSLFKTIHLKEAKNLHQQLCRIGIYVRLCDEENALRFGIPTNEQCNQLALRLAKL